MSALAWLVCSVILAVFLLFCYAFCVAAGRADDVTYQESTQTEKTVQRSPRIVYPGVPLTDDFQQFIAEQCKDTNVTTALVLAVIAKESNFEVDKTGDDGDSYGLMQIQPKWHSDRMRRLGVTNLFDAADNVRVGIDYLSELIDQGRSIEWALTAYNAGPNRANEYESRGIISDYAQEVVSMAECIARAALVISDE